MVERRQISEPLIERRTSDWLLRGTQCRRGRAQAATQNTLVRRHTLPSNESGGHAATCKASDPASRRCGIWLGGRCAGEGSFPQTGVPHLNPDASIFRAAFTSRSCDTPHRTHTPVLTTSCLRPLGPVREPQLEQARVVFRSLTICRDLQAYALL